jgi:predicted nucleotidyltransferase component of viral defense system
MTYGKLPLRNMLKGKMLKIAELQDKILIEISSKFEIVLHGGTAIWRMYKGKRFSVDIDMYHANPPDILEYFEKTGAFNMIRSKITSSNVLYSRFQEDDTLVEINVSPPFKKLQPIDGEFYLVDGDSIILKTLSATELLQEKISAFKDRKKARDLYDIFYLLDDANVPKIRNDVKSLMPLLKVMPKDFQKIQKGLLEVRV